MGKCCRIVGGKMTEGRKLAEGIGVELRGIARVSTGIN